MRNNITLANGWRVAFSTRASRSCRDGTQRAPARSFNVPGMRRARIIYYPEPGSRDLALITEKLARSQHKTFIYSSLSAGTLATKTRSASEKRAGEKRPEKTPGPLCREPGNSGSRPTTSMSAAIDPTRGGAPYRAARRRTAQGAGRASRDRAASYAVRRRVHRKTFLSRVRLASASNLGLSD